MIYVGCQWLCAWIVGVLDKKLQKFENKNTITICIAGIFVKNNYFLI